MSIEEIKDALADKEATAKATAYLRREGRRIRKQAQQDMRDCEYLELPPLAIKLATALLALFAGAVAWLALR